MSAGLRRVRPIMPGYARRRRGRGFEYLDDAGRTIREPDELERIRGLAIPPAWTDVWICRDPRGHLQAVGTDAAGRRQYLYHEAWRRRRDRAKYRRMEAFAEALPTLRAHVERDLRRRGLPRERVLATAVRLLDRGPFRIGTEAYAANGSYGLATLRKDHVRVGRNGATFDYVGKSGVRHTFQICDRAILPVLRSLRRHDGGRGELLAYRDDASWVDLRAADVNAYIQEAIGDDHTAKDFRTWRATVLAAVLLASADGPNPKRTVARVVRDVASHMGNTPAVCRSAYIDPRVLDRYLDEGETLRLGGVDVEAEAFGEDVEAQVLAFLRADMRKAA